MGYMWGIDVVEKASDVIERGWDAGVLVISAGDHTLRLLPPLIMSREQLTRGVNLIEQILS
jgi:acetylornithine/N-succinyldiaminopimelate aminotransferase